MLTHAPGANFFLRLLFCLSEPFHSFLLSEVTALWKQLCLEDFWWLPESTWNYCALITKGPHFWSHDSGEGVLMPQQSWEHPLFLPIPSAEMMYTSALWNCRLTLRRHYQLLCTDLCPYCVPLSFLFTSADCPFSIAIQHTWSLVPQKSCLCRMCLTCPFWPSRLTQSTGNISVGSPWYLWGLGLRSPPL